MFLEIPMRSALRLPHAPAAALAAAVALSITVGCHSVSEPSPANFTKGLTKHLAEHPDCLYKQPLRFPYETSDAAEVKQLDSLVGVKLLDRGTEAAIHVTRFTITDYGKKSAPRFCYGFRHVTGISSYTPPAKAADGFNESKVSYTYELQDVPVWAKTPAVQAAYPEMSRRVAGPTPETVTMAQTGVGWQVPE